MFIDELVRRRANTCEEAVEMLRQCLYAAMDKLTIIDQPLILTDVAHIFNQLSQLSEEGGQTWT